MAALVYAGATTCRGLEFAGVAPIEVFAQRFYISCPSGGHFRSLSRRISSPSTPGIRRSPARVCWSAHMHSGGEPPSDLGTGAHSLTGTRQRCYPALAWNRGSAVFFHTQVRNAFDTHKLHETGPRFGEWTDIKVGVDEVAVTERGFHIFRKRFLLFNYTEHSLGSDPPNKSARRPDASRRKPPSNVEARGSQPGIAPAA
jgi:hypothetical protein